MSSDEKEVYNERAKLKMQSQAADANSNDSNSKSKTKKANRLTPQQIYKLIRHSELKQKFSNLSEQECETKIAEEWGILTEIQRENFDLCGEVQDGLAKTGRLNCVEALKSAVLAKH